MTYKPLPSQLLPGHKIACRKLGYDPPEGLEVLKVYNDGHILLGRENSNRPFLPLPIETLRAYDYELVEESK